MSYLIGSDGRIYTTNNAPADLTYRIYNGFTVDHPHWNVTDTYANPLRATQVFEQGYIVGRDAGSLILSTPTSVFDGDIEAGVIEASSRPRRGRPPSAIPYQLTQTTVPLPGSLSLGQYGAFGLTGAYDTDVVIGEDDGVASGMTVTAAGAGSTGEHSLV